MYEYSLYLCCFYLLKREFFVRDPLCGSFYEAFKNANRGIPEEDKIKRPKKDPSATETMFDSTYEDLGMYYPSMNKYWIFTEFVFG